MNRLEHGERQRLDDAVGRLRVERVIGETLALVAAAARPLAQVWLAMAAVNLAISLIEPKGPADEFARNVFWLGESMAIGILSMVTVRTLLGVADPWRLDRGGLVFAAVDLASSVAGWIWNTVMPAHGAPPLSWLALAAWIAGGLATWWVFVRVALWTYAKGLRAPGVTLAQSWRRMRGAAVAIIGASVILAILPDQAVEFALGIAKPKLGGAIGHFAIQALSALKSAAFSVFIVAVPAAAWRLRGGAEADPLATIFD